MVRPVNAHPELEKMIFTLRIIVIFLALGVLLFLGYACYDHFLGGGADDKPGRGLITWLAIGVAVMNVITFAVVRGVVLRRGREAYRQKNIAGAVQNVQAATIIWCAGLEGAGLLAAIAFLLEGHLMMLGLAGFLVLMILFSIPTRDKVDAALE